MAFLWATYLIITGESKEQLENGVLPIVKAFMAKRGLELSEEKTLITHIDDGFDFLGCNARKYKGKLLIKPSKKNFKSIIDKIRTFVKENPSMNQESLIRKLNPMIRGWVNYQRYNVSVRAFENFDFQVFKCLWQWCCRRHPKKSKYWIKERYFHLIGNRNWTFSAKTDFRMDNGEPYYIRMIYATDTDIVRFTKIKSKVNPFDEDDAEYFQDREVTKMRTSIKDRYILEKLFRMQNGLCPICEQRITVETDFKVLDIKQEKKSLKFMLHPDCCKKVRSNGIVFEPAF